MYFIISKLSIYLSYSTNDVPDVIKHFSHYINLPLFLLQKKIINLHRIQWVTGFCSQSGVLALIGALSKTWGSQINLLPNEGKIIKNIGLRHLPFMPQVSSFSLGIRGGC